jgi:hypothetical protein
MTADELKTAAAKKKQEEAIIYECVAQTPSSLFFKN